MTNTTTTNATKSFNKSELIALIETLTPKAFEFFRAYAADSGNWSGTPLFNGNVVITSERADRGYLTKCKVAGLLTSWTESARDAGTSTSLTWVKFTDLGRALCIAIDITDPAKHGYCDGAEIIVVVDDMAVPADVAGPPLTPVESTCTRCGRAFSKCPSAASCDAEMARRNPPAPVEPAAPEFTQVIAPRNYGSDRESVLRFVVELHKDGERQFWFDVDSNAELKLDYKTVGDDLCWTVQPTASVNWPSIGTVSPEDARRFAQQILKAADLAEENLALLLVAQAERAAEKAAVLERMTVQVEAEQAKARAAGLLLSPAEADAAALAEAEADETPGV